MKRYILPILTATVISISFAQGAIPISDTFEYISSFFQQNPRLSVSLIFGIFMSMISRFAFYKQFTYNTQMANQLASAIGFGTFILFLFAVPEATINRVINYMTWIIFATLIIVGITALFRRAGGVGPSSAKAKFMLLGIMLILLSLLLQSLGVDI